MPLFKLSELNLKARRLYKSFATITREKELAPVDTNYDIFLSHCFKDANTVLGLSALLEEMGYLIYIDWINDPQLDRGKTLKSTAERLKLRMQHSKCLFYAFTQNYNDSIWMPWELGYFDGKKERAAILPIDDKDLSTESYVGSEYLGLYPYVTKNRINGSIDKKEILRINESPNKYVTFDKWLQGSSLHEHKKMIKVTYSNNKCS